LPTSGAGEQQSEQDDRKIEYWKIAQEWKLDEVEKITEGTSQGDDWS